MKEKLFSALKKSVADHAEIRVETEDQIYISFSGPEIDDVVSIKNMGGIVKAGLRGGWGISTFNTLHDIGNRVEDACDSANIMGHGKTVLAPAEMHEKEIRCSMKLDFRGISLDDKIMLIKKYNDILLGYHPSIVNSRVFYTEILRTVYFASTNGTYFIEERPRMILGFTAIAHDGRRLHKFQDGISSSKTYDDILNRENEIENTAAMAVNLMKAPSCEGGFRTVILDQELGGLFAHEAFGHLAEADFLCDNPKMQKLLPIGRKIGSDHLNIVDDGARDNLVSTNFFDDEGTETQKTYLIKNGTISGYLHSRETAAKMGAKPTGNARAVNYEHPPIVRMTNTYIENGPRDFKSLISGVDKGIYACGRVGGQTSKEAFTFKAAYGYRIENGELGELVGDVVLSGNVFTTLHDIEGIANDLKITQSIQGCSKEGQTFLPISFGSPHLRIEKLLVGGNRKG